MTGIELLRKYAEAMPTTATCGQLPEALGKECVDFESCYDCHRFVCNAIADQIERETLPRPRFEDGEPVQFGDEFVDSIRGNVGEVHLIKFYHNERWEVWGDSAAVDWRSRSLKRPEPPKVLDADGVEINVGDEVWGIGREQHAYKVLEPKSGDEYARERFTVKCVDLTYGELVVYADPSSLTHKRPEPPDTWERVEADSKKFVCDYYGRKLMFDCREGKSDACPVSGTDDECDTRMAQDLVRRCKALAGVE